MNLLRYHIRLPAVAFAVAAIGALAPFTQAETLRVVDYNIEADINSNGTGTLGAGLETVLEGIGLAHLNDNTVSHAQPLDVLALQEVSITSAPMLQSIVNSLNAAYGAGTYAFNPTVDPTDGGTGGGPNALIYNTKTVKVISAAALGSASGSGAARAPMQYVLQPMGYTSAANFYLDVSHAKSGTTADDANRRNVEATTLANNLATLGPNAHVISLGDFNITSGSAEATYQTMTSGTAGAAFTDSAHPSGSWSDTSVSGRRAISSLLSEKSTDDEFRDDIQFVSDAASFASGIPGLQYDAGSMDVFGNGGSTGLVDQSVTSGSNIGVFPDFTNTERSTVLADLLTASDHLPVVADYDIVGISNVPEPASLTILTLGGIALIRRRAR